MGILRVARTDIPAPLRCIVADGFQHRYYAANRHRHQVKYRLFKHSGQSIEKCRKIIHSIS